MISLQGGGGNSIGRVSVAANTPWYAVIPASPGLITRLVGLEIDNGATDNGIYVMRAIGGAVIQTAQAAADTTLILDRDPSATGNTIASGDQVVCLASDGTYRRVTVASWSAATLTLTVSALPAAVAAGSILWNFGVYTDTEPATGAAFPLIDTPVSDVTPKEFEVGFAGFAAGQPLVLYSPNAINATKLNYAEFAYTG